MIEKNDYKEEKYYEWVYGLKRFDTLEMSEADDCYAGIRDLAIIFFERYVEKINLGLHERLLRATCEKIMFSFDIMQSPKFPEPSDPNHISEQEMAEERQNIIDAVKRVQADVLNPCDNARLHDLLVYLENDDEDDGDDDLY